MNLFSVSYRKLVAPLDSSEDVIEGIECYNNLARCFAQDSDCFPRRWYAISDESVESFRRVFMKFTHDKKKKTYIYHKSDHSKRV